MFSLNIYFYFCMVLFLMLYAQAEGLDTSTGRPPYVKATAVTTRTATTHQDLEKNSKTSQVQ